MDGVQLTGQELGHGSYATVLELKYMGLKCAGKKIHDLLLHQTYVVNHFGEECSILSRVRHPNVVQFMGLFFENNMQTPILVMEFLPTDLTTCIEKYGQFPQDISYSILYDVALGLCYLHGQVPPIIHRDLSSNNVLLTTNMTAKISDLGMAKILDLTSMAQKQRTKIPGTPDFMPPEVMIPNPKYDRSIDDFSYGIIMIHVLSGQWPQAQVESVRIENGHLIPVSEAERREVFLQAIGDDHPLMDLILKCINNDCNKRAHANEIVERLEKAILQHPATFVNRLEMLKDIKTEKEAMKKETQELEMKIHKCFHEQLEQQNAEIVKLKMNMDDLKKQIDKERRSHKLQLRKQRDRLSLEMQSDFMAERLENESLQCALKVKDDNILRKDSEIKAKARIIEEKDSTISRLSEQFAQARDYLVAKQQVSTHILYFLYHTVNSISRLDADPDTPYSYYTHHRNHQLSLSLYLHFFVLSSHFFLYTFSYDIDHSTTSVYIVPCG